MEKESKKNTKKTVATKEKKTVKKEVKKTTTKKESKPIEKKEEAKVIEVVSKEPEIIKDNDNSEVIVNQKPEIIPNLEKKKKGKGLIISLIISFVLIITGILLFVFLSGDKNSYTHRIAQSLIDYYDFKESVNKKVFIFDEEPDKLEYSYKEGVQIYISYKEIKNESDVKGEIAIARYNSDVEAKKKIEFIKKQFKTFHEKYDNSFISETGDYYEIFANENNHLFNVGNYLISISSKYESDYDMLEKKLKEIIEPDNYNDKDIDEKKIEKFWDEQLEQTIENNNKTINSLKDKLINKMEESLDKFSNLSVEECIEYYNMALKYEKYDEFKEVTNKVKERYNQVIVNIIDFNGVAYNDAKAWCDTNMKYCSITQEYSDSVPSGSFISQSIEANTKVKRSDSFKLVYSKGKEPSLEFKNALKKANSYLSFMAFSYNSLIEQLEYEGYSHEAAVYAVDNCGADWNEQAAKKAKSYMDLMAFSRQGLIEQLEYEGFTYEQAVYGAASVGY